MIGMEMTRGSSPEMMEPGWRDSRSHEIILTSVESRWKKLMWRKSSEQDQEEDVSQVDELYEVWNFHNCSLDDKEKKTGSDNGRGWRSSWTSRSRVFVTSWVTRCLLTRLG